MCPELTFTVFSSSLTIASYTLFLCLGAATGLFLAIPPLRKAGLTSLQALSLLTLMAVFFLIGARLLNFFVNRGAYGYGLSLFSLRLVGFSVLGGILGAYAAHLLWCLIARRSTWPLLDALVLPSAAAFVLARIGCYLNGCCFGKMTESFLGVALPLKTGVQEFPPLLPLLSVNTIRVYPTQLFEAVLALLALIPALWLHSRKRSPPGKSFLLYGALFSAMRWAILPLRVLPYPEAVIKIVYPLIYGLLILTGAGLLLIRYIKINRHNSQKTGPAKH